ncbi:unnamed protein product [Cochlearia groenlandica]
MATIEDVVAIPLWNSKICHACFSEIVQSEIAVVCTNDDRKKPLRLGFTRLLTTITEHTMAMYQHVYSTQLVVPTNSSPSSLLTMS